jgi:hypothetical protein
MGFWLFWEPWMQPVGGARISKIIYNNKKGII